MTKMMRVWGLLVVALPLCLCVSCSDDDDDDDGDTVINYDSPVASGPSGTLYGHDYVDLGLSVKWAACNMGANSLIDYGDYYAWGEIAPKSEYTRENSVTYDREMDDIAGDAMYDAARANWGGRWRLPTKDEIDELVDNCTHEWLTLSGGVTGCRVTAPNGISIFLPAAGYRSESSLLSSGDLGSYWSSAPSEGITGSACGIFFGSDFFNENGEARLYGCSIRPVIE